MTVRSLFHCSSPIGIGEVKYGPCNGYSRTYKALVDYYRIQSRNVELQQNIRWLIDHTFEPAGDRIFDFKTFNVQDYNLEVEELSAMLTALRFNSWFKGLIITNYKLEKQSFQTVINVLQVNRIIEVLTLSGVVSNLQVGFPTVNPWVAMVDALASNTAISLRSLDLSNNNLDEKGNLNKIKKKICCLVLVFLYHVQRSLHCPRTTCSMRRWYVNYNH